MTAQRTQPAGESASVAPRSLVPGDSAPSPALGRGSPTGPLRGRLTDEFGVLAVLGVLVTVIAAFHPGFLSESSLVGVLRQGAFIAIMAFGMVFVVTMRDFDLSVGGGYALTLLLAATLMSAGLNPWLAATVGVAAGVGLGAFNGAVAELLRVPAIIVTLGTLSMYRGLAQIVSDGQPIADLPTQSSFFTALGASIAGIPVAAVVMVVLCVALSVVYKATRFGATVRAIGSNSAAAEFAGIRISRTRIAALMVLGAMVGISAMLSLAYFGSGDPTVGNGYELFVIAAVVIGATPLSGGRGTVFGALVGALIIQVIQSGLVFFGVAAQWSTFATGAVIVAAIALDTLLRRRRAAAATG